MDPQQTLFIDLETTGVKFSNDRICQIGAVLPGGKEMNQLVNPEMPIPAEASEIHGITNDMVKDSPRFAELANQIIETLEATKYFVAYNFLFDFQMLQAELFRTCDYVLNENDFIFVDPYKIHRTMYPSTLANVYKFYTKEEFTGAHDAMADILATKRILEEQHKAYPDLFAQSYEEVSEHTIGKVGILGKWFDSTEDNVITFRQGKHKGQIVNLEEHESYLMWIYGLDDTTISEKRFINDFRHTIISS